MSILKSQSLVLATAPYRESSMLLHLFSREFGRIHGVAKGVRRGDKRGVPIERGIVIEHTIYFKPQRDLHLITDSSICEYYPEIRNNLEKTAVRDVILDVARAAIKDTEPHESLFDTIIGCYNKLSDGGFTDETLLLFLSRRLFMVARQLGFGIDLAECAGCRKPLGRAGGAALIVADGTCRCAACISSVNRSGVWTFCAPVVSFLQNGTPEAAAVRFNEAMVAVHAAVEFCSYHLDIRRKLDSVGFLEHLFTMAMFRETH